MAGAEPGSSRSLSWVSHTGSRNPGGRWLGQGKQGGAHLRAGVAVCVRPSAEPPALRSAAIDLMYGGVYCFLCQDYIYDKDMEVIAKEEQRKAWKIQGVLVRGAPARGTLPSP